jgi:hypothetical protein
MANRLEVHFFRVAIPRQPRCQLIFRVEQPSIPRVGRKQRQGTDRYEASFVLSGASLDVADLVSEMEVLAFNMPLARPAFDGSPGPTRPPTSNRLQRWIGTLGSPASRATGANVEATKPRDSGEPPRTKSLHLCPKTAQTPVNQSRIDEL